MHVNVVVCVRRRCSWLVSEDGSVVQLTDDRRTTLTDVVDEMSSRGLRTIAIAFRDFVSGRRCPLIPAVFVSV